MNRWRWVLSLLTRRVWFRAALFCVFAIALALAGALAGPLVTYDFAAKVGAKSADSLLNVIASSMLTVTTFSLSVMVAAYWGAMNAVTPRAVRLLTDDPTSQNALSTFLGSFLFAIVGIIALSTGLYGDTGRVILYAGTILIVLAISITFLRWIQHISDFGRIADTIGRVERATLQAVGRMAQPPTPGADPAPPVPSGATMIFHDRIGRVTYVDVGDLGRVAAAIGATVTLLALPGAFVTPDRAIAWTSAPIDDRQRCRIRVAFSVANQRSFDHDPRFGLVVLSEIASRALSPAVNDPGTAIAVIEAGTRMLAAMLARQGDDVPALPPGVAMPPLALPDLIEDLFRPIAHHGAGTIEVAVRLQKALAALAALAPAAAAALNAEAADALDRAQAALTSARDRATLAGVVAHHWPATTA